MWELIAVALAAVLTAVGIAQMWRGKNASGLSTPLLNKNQPQGTPEIVEGDTKQEGCYINGPSVSDVPNICMRETAKGSQEHYTLTRVKETHSQLQSKPLCGIILSPQTSSSKVSSDSEVESDAANSDSDFDNKLQQTGSDSDSDSDSSESNSGSDGTAESDEGGPDSLVRSILPVRRETLTFVALDPSSYDFQRALGGWKVLDRVRDRELLVRVGCDPVTHEEFLDEDDDRPIIMLNCHTESIPCVFYEDTIRRCLLSLSECPSCRRMYPVLGSQPSGTMTIRPGFSQQDCTGYKGKGTIFIEYVFPSATQLPQHPNPGEQYYGTSRYVYLPNVPDGHEALGLLKKAFMLGELFMVGTSLTTGCPNSVIWGSIHQKTSRSGGALGHGWPDPSYFDRLKQECGAKGIFVDGSEHDSFFAQHLDEIVSL